MKIPARFKELMGYGGDSEVRGLDAEGPDKAWLDAHAQERRERFDRDRDQERIARAARREAMPLSVRLRALEMRILTASTVSAPADGGRGGKPGSKPPPRVEMLEVGGADPEEVERLLRLVRDGIAKLEDLVDGSRHIGEHALLTGTDLDRMLRTKYRGYPPEDVSALEPALGSPEAVRRARARLELHRETGDPR